MATIDELRTEHGFPTNREEAATWMPHVEYRGLGGQNHKCGAILAVACTRVECAWKAYIGIVPGHNFDDEYQAVLDIGSPLPQKVAEVLFPRFKVLPWAR